MVDLEMQIGLQLVPFVACLNVVKLILDSAAVTTELITPGHHGSIRQAFSKSRVCARNLLNIPQLILDSGAVTASVWIAQVTTVPSAKIAAKAEFVLEIC